MQALSTAKTGDICMIKWMFGLPEVIAFMHSCQIREGSTIQIIKADSDQLIIGAGDRRIALDKEIASRIQV